MPEIKLLEKALLDIAALFEKHNIRYMVIGGLADLLDRPGIFSQWQTWKKKA